MENHWRTPFDLSDKVRTASVLKAYQLLRTLKMFKYDGMPDTIPPEYLELILQTSGKCIISNAYNGKDLYAYYGEFSGEPDPYGIPKLFTFANAGQGYSATLEIGTECVLCRNDYLMYALRDLNDLYASILAENLLSLDVASIMSRMTALIVGETDSDKKAADKFIADLKRGEYGSVVSNGFNEGITVNPIKAGANDRGISELIQYHQYFRGLWDMELGLKSTTLMKKEPVVEDEINAMDDKLLPLVDDMLECRRLFVSQVNDLYGTDISVDLDSAWNVRHQIAGHIAEGEPTIEGGNIADPDGTPNASTDASTDASTELAPDPAPNTGTDSIADELPDGNSVPESDESEINPDDVPNVEVTVNITTGDDAIVETITGGSEPEIEGGEEDESERES